MRILHICQRDDPDTGGSLRVAEALVREQRACGYDAWLLFLYGEPAAVSSSLAPYTIGLRLASSRQALRGVVKLCSEIRRLHPDLIHSHDGIVWPRLAFLCFRIPVVMHSHLPVTNSSSPVGRMLIHKTTDLVIGISIHTIETWVNSGFPPSRIHYVSNGVDFERFSILDPQAKALARNRLGLPMDQHLLLWVGRLHQSMKGSDRVERVARLLPEGVVLVVVGNGPDYSAMVHRCASLIDQGRLIMVGSSSTPEAFYQVADSFLFTSYYEPFGLVILEAIASGLPIIAFPVTAGGGAVDLLAEFGAIMMHDDSISRAALEQGLQAGALRRDDVQRTRQQMIHAYSWKQISEKVVDVYAVALNRGLCR